ncbi:MAG: phosphoribosylglycinamide formyltransferase [Candidatus Tectomicrobia bacterium]|uniref:Phosphoribosylglycinamide formyltransferase n=1 Tax=Tectimicrobiota bacterium TaxID=2528274 RepID=A0A937W2M2_UNCTE|nr:phosphoribosylglycinamide formyltransferase [Candidatus Tectomicrobia bacterium]
MTRVLQLAVLLSGSGRTLENLQQAILAGRLHAQVAVVVSSKRDAYGLVRARQYHLDAVAVPRKDYPEASAFSTAINAVLARYPIDLVVLAGFLSLYHPPPALTDCVMNVHPALLPAFGGKGFYGERVHRAVLEAGVKLSGCTVHFADAIYDHGPIILQAAVPVEEDDTSETLAARVFTAECALYPRAIQLFADNRLRREGRRVRILPDTAA